MNINTRKGYIGKVTIREVEAKSILRKHKKMDSWFISQYGMNIYRGCMHNCIYCDGRSEGYFVEGEFGEDVAVKVNAIDILRRELDLKRKRTPFNSCYIMVGGGVGDSYQPIEKKYELTRKVLQLMIEKNLPVSMLTKSTLVERDIDIFKEINHKSGAIVSFSFSSVDDKVSTIFEPGVPPPSKRLKSLALFKKEGIACGMFLMPVIPFVTDSAQMMEQAVGKASEIGVDFIIFSGMTLKEGKQQDYFYRRLEQYYPELLTEYQNIYTGNKWGQPTGAYYDSLNYMFRSIAKQYRVPLRIPAKLYSNILNENDLVMVMLEQIDYLLKLEGKKSPYGFAAYSISQLKEPLSDMKKDSRKLKGVGKVTERIILDILETGNSTYYEKLLFG